MQNVGSDNERLVVLCVLDGHGKEVGKVAAVAAKACLFKYLDENYLTLLMADRSEL